MWNGENPFFVLKYLISLSDMVLTYLINLLSGLAVPFFILIIASWRVARLRHVSIENYQERVDETVANTLKDICV